MEERDIVIDIESGVDTSREVGNTDPSDELVKHEVVVNLSNNDKTVNGVSPNSTKNTKKDRRKSTGAKKPPKPPRPPRGLSLDAADQKLIKEISELAMIKRARLERMRKKTKAAKALSASASSSGNFIAMLFTILFCIVIIIQGCHSSGGSQSNSSAVDIPGSSIVNGAAEGNVAVIQDHSNLSTNSVQTSSDGSPNVMELISSSDNKNEQKRALNQ